jgi:hypothetical protein
LDLFVAEGGLDLKEEQPNRTFQNLGGKFVDVSGGVGTEFSVPRLYRGAVFADFNRDGRLDAAVSSLNSPIELWWNESPMRHRFQLRLEGTRGNRSAIGAQVICKTASRTQSRRVNSSVGHASSSKLTVHFGLGKSRKAVVEIHWPSMQVQKLGETLANQRLKVQELV